MGINAMTNEEILSREETQTDDVFLGICDKF